MYKNSRIAVLIPALNEAENIVTVLQGIPDFVDYTIVADNGSTDGTDRLAREHGALVAQARRQGYGAACLAGMALIEKLNVDVVVFVSGDGSDLLEEMTFLLQPIVEQDYDLVIGSRRLGLVEPKAMTFVQGFGNRLAATLINLFWHAHVTDLGPYRAISKKALMALGMRDQDYGWTVEMQLKAIKNGLKYKEIPVSYRARRHGAPKVAGTFKGTLGAGYKILGWIFYEALKDIAAKWQARAPKAPKMP